MSKAQDKDKRGGTSGRSFAPRRTIYKDKNAPQMWVEFMAANKKYREEHGLSAQALASLMGVSVGVIYTWEQGIAQPHPWDLTVYLEAIGYERLRGE